MFFLFRKRGPRNERKLDKILYKASALKDQAHQDHLSIAAALTTLGEEAARVQAVKDRLGKLGI
jgi:hypothetical protein